MGCDAVRCWQARRLRRPRAREEWTKAAGEGSAAQSRSAVTPTLTVDVVARSMSVRRSQRREAVSCRFWGQFAEGAAARRPWACASSIHHIAHAAGSAWREGDVETLLRCPVISQPERPFRAHALWSPALWPRSTYFCAFRMQAQSGDSRWRRSPELTALCRSSEQAARGKVVQHRGKHRSGPASSITMCSNGVVTGAASTLHRQQRPPLLQYTGTMTSTASGSRRGAARAQSAAPGYNSGGIAFVRRHQPAAELASGCAFGAAEFAAGARAD